MNIGKAALAELIGTFTLTFIGAGAAVATSLAGNATGTMPGLIGVALAHGVALMFIVYTWVAVSGAHANPAVTLGVLVGRKIELGRAIVYWIAQFAGAVAASYTLAYLVGQGNLLFGETIGKFTQEDPVKVIVLEAILTFFLVAAVYSSAVFNRNGAAVGLAIGLVLTADILMGGPYTGASMNPARTFGPALVSNNLGYVGLYVIGPAIGGALAGIVQAYVIGSEESKP